MWNDFLIALSARQVGVPLVTEDLDDIELLRRYVRVDVVALPAD